MNKTIGFSSSLLVTYYLFFSLLSIVASFSNSNYFHHPSKYFHHYQFFTQINAFKNTGFDEKRDDNKKKEEEPDNKKIFLSRREALRPLSLTSMAAVISATSKPEKANAACLYGDLSPSCIGIYKVPLDDNILSYVSTPEQLSKYAPGITYVPPVPYPPNSEAAYNDIMSCENDIMVNLESDIRNGKLESAGILILSIIPKLTMAGRVVVPALNNLASSSSTFAMKGFRVETAIQTLISTLSGLDICIGQGIRGELGVITAAQILLLQDVKEVKDNFVELKRAFPDNFPAISRIQG